MLTMQRKMSWCFFNLFDLKSQTINWEMRGIVMRDSSMAMVRKGNS